MHSNISLPVAYINTTDFLYPSIYYNNNATKLVFSQEGIDSRELIYYLNNCQEGNYFLDNIPLDYTKPSNISYEFPSNTLYNGLYRLKYLWKNELNNFIYIIQYSNDKIKLFSNINKYESKDSLLEYYNFIENQENNIKHWEFQCYYYNLQCIFVNYDEFIETKIISGLGYFGNCENDFQESQNNIYIEPVKPYDTPILPKSRIISGIPPFNENDTMLVFANFRTGSTAMVDKLNNCTGDSILEIGGDLKVNSQQMFNNYIHSDKHYKIMTLEFYKYQTYIKEYINTYPDNTISFIFLERQNKIDEIVSNTVLWEGIKKFGYSKVHALSQEDKKALEISMSPRSILLYYKKFISHYKDDFIKLCNSFSNINCIILQTEDFIKSNQIPGFDKNWDCETILVG